MLFQLPEGLAEAVNPREDLSYEYTLFGKGHTKVLKRSRIRKREYASALLFLAPWIIGFVVFEIGPLLASGTISFFKWDLIGDPRWAGLANYEELFTRDALFWQSFKVTTIYSLSSIPLRLALALLVALLMNQKVPGIAAFRTIFYMPSVVSGVVMAMIWFWVFNSRFGILNHFLGLMGIDGPNWLMDTKWVMPAFVVMSLWSIGAPMITFLAGLQGVPQELYDAASVDGAGRWRVFWSVTWPLLTPVVFFNLVTGVISSFQTFTASYVMTEGGPANSTLFYVLYLYRNAFKVFRMGKACAMAWILFVLVLVLTTLMFKSSPLWVFYETEVEGRR